MSTPIQLEAQAVAARRLANFLALNGDALDLEDALAIARGAVALAPVSESHNALAGVLNEVPGAEQLQTEAADAAIGDDPDNWAAWHNKSLALLRLHRTNEAAQAISKALRLLPAGQANPYLAMQAAFIAGIRGRHEQVLDYLIEAEAVADRLDAANPKEARLAATVRAECTIARFVAYAQMNKWADAFAALSHRFDASLSRDMVTTAAQAGRLWKPGVEPKHKDVIVVLEWGLGDQIQFARFVPELVKQGVFASVSVACSAPLQTVIRTLDGIVACMDRDALAPAILDSYEVVAALDLMADHWARTGDPVGGALGGGRGNPYLKAPGKSKPDLGNDGKPAVAFAWQGDPRQTHDWNRRLPLAGFGEWAAANREFAFVSLQTRFAGYGEPWAGWPDDVPVVDAAASLIVSDMGDVADWIEAADVFVGQCGGLVHLAGALGKPAVVMLAASHDWRWDQSPPLYASVVPVVQATPGDWPSAFAKLTETITAFGIVPPPLPVEVPAAEAAAAPEPVVVEAAAAPAAEAPAVAPVLSEHPSDTLPRFVKVAGTAPEPVVDEAPAPDAIEAEPNFAYMGEEETAAYHARKAARGPVVEVEQPADSAAIQTEGETQQ